MNCIGVVGFNGSGKDEVVKYLHLKYNVPSISVGDIVRELAGQEGKELTRDNLDEITRRYFARFGNGYFVKLVIDKIRQSRWSSVGISGIRSPQDVTILKEAFNKDFKLIHVYITDNKVRFQRMLVRGSKRDEITYEDFLKQDQTTRELFHMEEVSSLADYSLSNDGTLEDLQTQIDQLISDARLLI